MPSLASLVFFYIAELYTLCDNWGMSNLDRTKQRGVWFVGTTKCPADIENIKRNIKEFFFYAYIFHKPDEDDERLHIHYVVQCNGSRSLQNVADTLDVSSQYMQICKQPRGANRYLIHLDNPEKEQYKETDVFTNNRDFYHSFLTDNHNIDCTALFDDLVNLRSGRIGCREFVQKYEYTLNKLPFYQRIKTMEVILKMS